MSCFSQVQFLISDTAFNAWSLVGESLLLSAEEAQTKKKSKMGEESITFTYLSENDLANTKTGRGNMLMYVQSMVADFEKHFWEILGSDGMLNLGKKKVPWDMLQHQIPTYFSLKYGRGGEKWKKLSAEEKAKPYGALVLRELQAKTPRVDCPAKLFLQWLDDIHVEGQLLKM